jgi:hypothetical protein
MESEEVPIKGFIQTFLSYMKPSPEDDNQPDNSPTLGGCSNTLMGSGDSSDDPVERIQTSTNYKKP